MRGIKVKVTPQDDLADINLKMVISHFPDEIGDIKLNMPMDRKIARKVASVLLRACDYLDACDKHNAFSLAYIEGPEEEAAFDELKAKQEALSGKEYSGVIGPITKWIENE